MSSRLGPESSVCALIPHFECHQWLADTLMSLRNQTRRLDAIVVIDDASSQPPIDIVDQFPEVSLLVAPDNGGPYRLVQTVIEATSFDAYMFQDADDWSAPRRLELLLGAAAHTGAELIGSHEVRIDVDAADVEYLRFPLDVNATMTLRPTAHALLHPTSLVSRALLERLGGFATGMRFSGDSEFLQRAVHAGKVVNIDDFLYYRRKRQGALTTDPATALKSPARLRVIEAINARAKANHERIAAGEQPDLAPWVTTPPAQLQHVTGPPIGLETRREPVSPMVGTRDVEVGVPVFVLGPSGARAALLACALAQSPSLHLLSDSRWLTEVARSVLRSAHDGAEWSDSLSADAPASLPVSIASSLYAMASAGGSEGFVTYGPSVTRNAWILATVFETARFVILEAPAAATPPAEEDWGATAWVEAMRSCLDLELALGAERVLRVGHREMFDDVDGVVRRVLNFANARYDSACAWVFDGVTCGPDEPLPTVSARLMTEIAELEQRLLTQTAGLPDPDAARRLRQQRSEFSRSMEIPFVEDFRSFVSGVVPSGAVVAVISRGDEHLVDIPGAVGWHFPQIDRGVYSGSHPADSDEAVDHLEVLRARGAEFLAVPASAFWWFDHYDGFRHHLNRYRMVAYRDSSGVVYALDDTTRTSLDVVVRPDGKSRS